MFNILLDILPTEYKGFRIDPSFQVGIQVYQILHDDELTKQERIGTAIALLFPDKDEESGEQLPVPDLETALEGIEWFLSDWMHDNSDECTDEEKQTIMDYDIDQWRIYSAFWSQYKIDLNCTDLHFWQFMGLLQNLEDCAFHRVMGIRQAKITPKMSAEEKTALRRRKRVYALKQAEPELSAEDQEAVDQFMAFVKGR